MNQFVVLSRWKYLLYLVVVMFSACQVAPDKGPGWSSASGEIRPGPKTTRAVLALVGKARQASRRSDLTTAETYLERALRIEPRNPALWLYLAKLRLYAGKTADALNLAKKSLALSAAVPAGKQRNRLQADAWRVMAHAWKQQGVADKAKQAGDKARALME